MKPNVWQTYQTLLTSVPFVMAPVPAPLPVFSAINPKDMHVVAAATEISAAYLLTLDKGLLAEAQQAQLMFATLIPGDFIKTILPTHVSYPAFP